MKNNTLLTLFQIPIEEMSRDELKTEIRLQKYHKVIFKRELSTLLKAARDKKPSKIRYDKIDFLDMYIKVIDGFIADLEKRASTKTDGTPEGRKKAKKNFDHLDKSRKTAIANLKANNDGTQLTWDREKFMSVARDRGFLTEQSIIYAVEKELAMTRPVATLLLEKGKFTWGQVMCIGAMLQMTPKEFCDIFMSGYFVDYHGQFIASYENIDKTVLLKRATVMSKKELQEADTAIAEMEAAAD